MHLVNGEFGSQISLLDRGLLYGHSVFETIAVTQRKPLLLEAHLARLAVGCERLRIPFALDELREDINLIAQSFDLEDCVFRVSQTMGVGGRGYLSPENSNGTRIVSAFPMPVRQASNWYEGIILGKVGLRIADQPALAGIKHSNRLEQILARFEWQADWQEALLLDTNERVIEATQSNVFIYTDGRLLTPDLTHQGVRGVMREQILTMASTELGADCDVVRLSVDDLRNADEVFVCNSLIGLWPVRKFQEREYPSIEFAFNLLETLLNNEIIPPI